VAVSDALDAVVLLSYEYIAQARRRYFVGFSMASLDYPVR